MLRFINVTSSTVATVRFFNFVTFAEEVISDIGGGCVSPLKVYFSLLNPLGVFYAAMR